MSARKKPTVEASEQRIAELEARVDRLATFLARLADEMGTLINQRACDLEQRFDVIEEEAVRAMSLGARRAYGEAMHQDPEIFDEQLADEST